MGNFTGEVIGVIGGCGVAAAIELLHLIEKKLVTKYNCINDPEQPEVILHQATQAPSRINYAAGTSSVSFAPYFIKVAKMLKYAGATLGCIPCNTAHCVIDTIEKESGLPFINLIDTTLTYVTTQYPDVCNVGILCSVGTVHSKIYDNSKNKFFKNLNIIYPSANLQESINEGIFAVKSGIMYKDPLKGQEYFFKSLEYLENQGAELIILGCTEIPLALTDIKYKNIPLVNTIDVLAEECINRCRK